MGGGEASRVPREYPADAPARQSRQILPKKSQTGAPSPTATAGGRGGGYFWSEGGGIEQRVGVVCRKLVIRAGAVTLGMFARNFGMQ
jgi:hypothetical protein